MGVGCCTVECYPRFLLKDDDGKEVASITDKDTKGNDLGYGKDSLVLDRKLTLTLPTSVKGSNLTLYVAMVDKDNKPIISLPYNAVSSDNKRMYKVTKVAVN